MFADQALRCECGYEVRATDEAARVDEVRRHASETHGIDLSNDVALDVVRRKHRQHERPDAQRRNAAHEQADPDDSKRVAERLPSGEE